MNTVTFGVPLQKFWENLHFFTEPSAELNVKTFTRSCNLMISIKMLGPCANRRGQRVAAKYSVYGKASVVTLEAIPQYGSGIRHTSGLGTQQTLGEQTGHIRMSVQIEIVVAARCALSGTRWLRMGLSISKSQRLTGAKHQSPKAI